MSDGPQVQVAGIKHQVMRGTGAPLPVEDPDMAEVGQGPRTNKHQKRWTHCMMVASRTSDRSLLCCTTALVSLEMY